MSNSIFIDSSNMNTLLRINGKFRVGLNYASNPEQLVIDANALGATYDVYMSVWPRPEAEGDCLVDALSIGGVPFVVLREEMLAIIRYLEMFTGATNIYICNALANYSVHTRVGNFQSAFHCGNRVAFVTVKDRMLSELKMYDSPADFYEDNGERFVCYGDADLLSLETIKSQYPELSNLQKTDLVPVMPLVTSYQSMHRMEFYAFKEAVMSGEEYEYKAEPVKETPKEEETEEPTKPVIEKVSALAKNSDGEDMNSAKRARANRLATKATRKHSSKFIAGDNIVKLCFALSCLLGFVIGVERYADTIPSMKPTYTQPLAAFEAEAKKYSDITKVYAAPSNPGKLAQEVYNRAKANDIGVIVSEVVGMPEYTTIYFSVTSSTAEDSFNQYMSNYFDILDRGSLGEVGTETGEPVINYYYKLLPRS